jgi:septum formation protein
VELAESRVAFRSLDEATIGEYLRHVNPMDKAGAYDIDQRADLIIAGFSGSRTNVMGLPEELVAKWLRRLQADAGA